MGGYGGTSNCGSVGEGACKNIYICFEKVSKRGILGNSLSFFGLYQPSRFFNYKTHANLGFNSNILNYPNNVLTVEKTN